MNPFFQTAFERFVRQKEKVAGSAVLETFQPEVDQSHRFGVEAIGSPFTENVLGPFYQSPVPLSQVPAMNLVFVQSRDGNTEADDPSTLGGGKTDKHMIYEGLSRVSADAVIAGAKTAGDGNVIFSVWHPEVVALRRALGRARHPVQVVASLTGALAIETGLLFNVPEIQVVILSAGSIASALAERCRSRPWITVISSGHEPQLRLGAARLRRDFGLTRISAVGGRRLATALIDVGLVRDIYLTTSPHRGGIPNTPMYAGEHQVSGDLVVRKRSEAGVTFEHLVLPST